MERRSVSVPGAPVDQPETVWSMQIPEIRFGQGAINELTAQLELLDVYAPSQGLLITDETIASLGHANRIRDKLSNDGFNIDIFDKARREPSIDSINDCIDYIENNENGDGYDFYLGVGGGTCMDTAKVARTIRANEGEIIDYISKPTGKGENLNSSGEPLILLPTTAGTGSEISSVAIVDVPEQETKEGIASPYVRADAAVLDPTLSVTLPPDETALCGMDALGQAIEGYLTHSYDSLLHAPDPSERPIYAGRTPLTEMFCEKAIELLTGNLRRAVHNGDDIRARSKMMLGALYGGIAALTAGANLCHAMSYPVANKWKTHHGETIAVLTPATTFEYIAGSNPSRFEFISKCLGVDVDGLNDRELPTSAKEEYIHLQQDLNVIPRGLHQLTGADEEDVDELAKCCMQQQKRLLRCSPRLITEEQLSEIYRDALYNW